MAIWARNLSSSFSSTVIFFRASGSADCLTDVTPLWAWFRVGGPGYLATFRFTVLRFFGGKWFLCRPKTSVFYSLYIFWKNTRNALIYSHLYVYTVYHNIWLFPPPIPANTNVFSKLHRKENVQFNAFLNRDQWSPAQTGCLQVSYRFILCFRTSLDHEMIYKRAQSYYAFKETNAIKDWTATNIVRLIKGHLAAALTTFITVTTEKNHILILC